jgi:hypothetical protein
MPSESLKGFHFLRAFKMEKVLFENAQWKVLNDLTILCENPFYEITKDMLNACDWLAHLEEKNWVKLNLFQEAYEFVIEKTN